MAKKLFVGNLPWSVKNDDLAQMFSESGTVSNAQVITERGTGRSKGFGFVEFDNDDEAMAAIEKFNGYEIEGRGLTVNEARPMEPRAPRRDFGGRDNNRSGGRSW